MGDDHVNLPRPVPHINGDIFGMANQGNVD
jgi:hypothetical protein